MGFVDNGIPKRLTRELIRRLDLHDFVETGTHIGMSALWASDHFERVWTVEIEPSLYEQARARLAGRPNVEQLLGNSVEMLRSIVRHLERPALFWLDAHWSAGDTGGASYPCPLLDEIEIIDAGPVQHVIMIDDSRDIMNAKFPFTAGRWPNIGIVCENLRRRHADAYIAVHNDILFRIPRESVPVFETFLREFAGEPEPRVPVHLRIRHVLRLRSRLKWIMGFR